MLISIAFTAIATSLPSITDLHTYSEDTLFEYPSHHRLPWQVCTDYPTSLQANAAINRHSCLPNPCQFIIQESS